MCVELKELAETNVNIAITKDKNVTKEAHISNPKNSSPNPTISRNVILGITAVFLSIVLTVGGVKYFFSKKKDEIESDLTNMESNLEKNGNEYPVKYENDYQVWSFL